VEVKKGDEMAGERQAKRAAVVMSAEERLEHVKQKKREAARKRYHDQYQKILETEATLEVKTAENERLKRELREGEEEEECLMQRKMELEAVQRILKMTNKSLKAELEELQAAA
jgi:glycyl-tRNA synthetase alpha subunit